MGSLSLVEFLVIFYSFNSIEGFVRYVEMERYCERGGNFVPLYRVHFNNLMLFPLVTSFLFFIQFCRAYQKILLKRVFILVICVLCLIYK